MTELDEINVKLSMDQKIEIFKTFFDREKTTLFLKNEALRGSDTLLVPRKIFYFNNSDYRCLRPDKKLFSEMYDNNFRFIPSVNDEGVKYFQLIVPPTVVEKLEEARKNNEGVEIFLDYSLTNCTMMCSFFQHDVLKNILKLMGDII